MTNPPAIRVLAHPPCVRLNEADMLRSAALVVAGEMRSGRLRLPLPRRAPSPPPPSPSSRGSSSPLLLNSPASETPPAFEQDDIFGGLGGDDVEEEGEEEEEAAKAGSTVSAGLSAAQFASAQQADAIRLPWAWRPQGRSTEQYVPVVGGKWWSHTTPQLEALPASKRRDVGHIGRIMETELGEQLLGEDRCTACQNLDEECWVYTRKGAQQVSRPGDACARCRLVARKGGCSVSKRLQGGRPKPPPSPGPGSLAAYKPFGGPPPGAGGSGIAV